MMNHKFWSKLICFASLVLVTASFTGCGGAAENSVAPVPVETKSPEEMKALQDHYKGSNDPKDYQSN